ncbi:alpha/beta hydrolase-fold protein [Dyadobacter aurulentus]|uniref:alpha/beta hydrolase-fold protein n=1 Tax=Dyadobacter sp. UC 10 TaxID=2605428 RepID=UPI001788D2CB|nr:alpha/beta hydrolase-fold protein [Dyadobacter sp. UC 10]
MDSMIASAGRADWKAAVHWALKAGEAVPAEKNWRLLNAAIFASHDRNADLALYYVTQVVNSDIAVKASYNNNFDWLRDDPRWLKLMQRVDELREEERQQRIKASLPFRNSQQILLGETAGYLDSLRQIPSAAQLYQEIQKQSPKHSDSHAGRYAYAWIKLSDTLEFPYLVQLPPNFDSNKSYPLIVVLHGAVGRQTMLREVADSIGVNFFGREFAEQALQFGMIAVFPYSTSRYNWMMPDDGFDLVPQLVRQIKKMYPVNDRRVYVAGHSNGATGAFSYLMKQPGLFAGFAGVNNRPEVRTGGTFLKNGVNRSFYNISTDLDYYFPLEGHRAITSLAKQLGVDWQNHEISGNRNHSYMIVSRDSTVKEAYRKLFENLLSKERNPFQPALYWECDDTRHGRSDWLEITGLDTLEARASWHKEVNTAVTGWREVVKPEILLDSTSNAFAFPRRSGAVQASYANNRFELTTSGVKSVAIYLSPEMVDFGRPVQVFINGKMVHNASVEESRSSLLDEYSREFDHQAIWTNRLQFTLPQR